MKKLIVFLFAFFLMAEVLVAEEKPESKVEEPQKSVIKTLFSTDIRQKKGEEDKKLFFSGSFGFNWVAGNRSWMSETIETGFNASTKWDDNITKVVASYEHSFFSWPVSEDLNSSGQYSETQLLQRWLFSLHMDNYIANRWEFFTFADVESSEYWGLGYRLSMGAGIKFVVFRNKYWTLDIGTAPLFEQTSYEGQNLLKELRLSSRIKTEFVIYEFARLGGKFFYIPNMLDFPDDYRYDLETYLALHYFLDEKKTKSVVVKFLYKRQYNSNPNANTPRSMPNQKVQELDQYIMTSIGAEF